MYPEEVRDYEEPTSTFLGDRIIYCDRHNYYDVGNCYLCSEEDALTIAKKHGWLPYGEEEYND